MPEAEQNRRVECTALCGCAVRNSSLHQRIGESLRHSSILVAFHRLTDWCAQPVSTTTALILFSTDSALRKNGVVST
jgi:hypothetical protein